MPLDMFRDATDAYWDYLGSQPSYTSLGLKEFRRRDGNIFGIADSDGVPRSVDDYPAHVCTETAFSFDINREPNGGLWSVSMSLNVTYMTEGADDTSTQALAASAMAMILSIINSANARRNNLGAAQNVIDKYEFKVRDEQPVVFDGDRFVRFWNYPYTIRLIRSRLE